MEPVNKLSMEFTALPDNVGFARVAVACFASRLGFTVEDVEDIKLIVSEAVSNSIIHGYSERSGLVRIICELTDNEMNLVISDTGRGIEDIEKARQPAYSTDPERMGMGLTLIEALADFMNIESVPGRGTTLIIRKVVHS